MPRGTLAGQLAAMGFADTARARQLLTEDLGPGPDGADAPLVEALAAAADPDLALAALARLAPDASCARRCGPTRSCATGWSPCSGSAPRSATTWPASPATGGCWPARPRWPGPRPGELAATLLRGQPASAGDRDPADRAAAGLPAAAAAPGRARPDRRRPAGQRDGRAGRPGRRRAAGGAGHRRASPSSPPGVARRARAARVRSRTGQRRARARGRCDYASAMRRDLRGRGRELNYASDVDVIFAAGAAAGEAGAAALGHRAGQRHDPDLLARPRPRARCSPSTRTCAPRAGTARWSARVASHRAYYERWAKTWEFQALLKARPVAGDRRDSARRTWPRSARWSGRRRSGRTSWPTSRPCAAGCSAACPPTRRAGSSSWAPAGCATSSSRSSCCSSCTAGPTSRCGRPGTLDGLRALAAGGYVGRADAAAAGRRLPVPAHASSTCSSSGSCAAPTRCPRTGPCCARSAGRCAGCGPPRGPGARRPGRRADPASGAGTPRGPAAAREAVLPAAARRGGPAARRGGPADPGRGRGPAGGPRATWTRPGRCGTSRRSPPGVSRRAAIQRTLLPVLLGWFADAPQPDAGLLAFRQVSEALGQLALVPAAAARQHPGGPADGPGAGLQPVRHRAAAARPRGGRDAGRRPASWPRARPRRCAPRRWPRWAGTRWRRRPSAPCWPSAAASCCAPPWPTCSAWPGSTERGEALTTVAEVTVAAALAAAVAEVEQADRAAADPAGGDRHGPARRPGDGLRQRRRRDVRARPAARRGRGGRTAGRARGGRDAARAAGHGPARTRPCRRRGPAARGPAGPAGPHAGLLPGLLPALVGALGGAGPAAGRVRRPATPSSAPTFTALADEVRYPDGRDRRGRRSGRSGGSRPGWRPSGCRAAWTRP